MHPGLLISLFCLFITCVAFGDKAPQRIITMPHHSETAAAAISERTHSFSYWLNGMRKSENDTSAAVLCFETGYYGFSLDIEDFGQARFGRFATALDYNEALQSGATRLDQLKPIDLAFEIESDGKIYRAIGCRPSLGTHATYPEVARQYDAGKLVQHLDASLWESGRLVQHYDLQRLQFKAADGEVLTCESLLDIVVWPESLTLTAEVSPASSYADGWHRGVAGSGLCLVDNARQLPAHEGVDSKNFTVECWVKIPEVLEHPRAGWLLSKNGDATAAGFYGFQMEYGKVAAVMNTTGGAEHQYTIKQPSYKPLARIWNHLVLSYDSAVMSYYLNGKLQGSETIAEARIPSDGALWLGRDGSEATAISTGVFDQIRIWDRALSEDEVKAHTAKPTELSSQKGLILEENFEANEVPAMLDPVWKDATLRVSLKNDDHQWQAEKKIAGEWSVGEKKQVTLNCNLSAAAVDQAPISVQVNAVNGQAYPVEFNAMTNGYVAEVKKVQRDWKTGYTDIRNYDEFDIVVENSGDSAINVPFLFYLRDVANVTGVCPMLCDVNGVPTGIPVQLSKNWHDAKLGAYLRSYMQIPAEPGTSTYRLRLVYSFYGTLPSASHAQLSLVGYGGLGRWDQLTIGSWGETFCFDMDMSCVDVAITDVRLLMGRNGLKGGKWTWTDAAWGGDWLKVNDAKDQKLYFSELKTAYLAHGPCLSEVRHDGCYGSQREVDVATTIRTLRTDDFARTFQDIDYRFNQEASAEDGWLFKMGGSIRSISPTIAYGNRSGLLKAEAVPADLDLGERYLDQVTLTGEGPWWVGFPGGYTNHDKDWGTGSRGLIIRSYKATFGGKTFTNPTISMAVIMMHDGGRKNLDLYLTPPAGVARYQPGDRVDMDLEWITLPRVADDYYGPNEAFRAHLTEHPKSWKSIHREAVGNDLNVEVSGGTVQQAYPIIIQADQPEITVKIEGGLGMVPIRFEGLKFAKDYALFQIVDGKAVELDQSNHGNDFWQTDFDVKSNSYKMTFNLPIDGVESSTWVLRRK
ncbi:MAG: LamG domain-containing protein [Lentimonas sp.]